MLLLRRAILVSATIASCRATSDSKHYKVPGDAIDIRGNNVKDADGKKIAADLQNQLGTDYTVIFEQPNFGKEDYNPSDDHIHIQFNRP